MKRLITLGAAVLLLSLTVTPATAIDKQPTFDPIDIEAAAKYDGVDLTVETARMTAREAVGPIIDNLDPDLFTGAYFTRGDGAPYVLHIVIKEGATAPALDMPTSTALEVTYDSGKFSKAELDEQRAKLLANLPEGFVSVGTDMTTGQLRLTVDSLTAQNAALANFPDTTVELGQPPKSASGNCFSRTDCRPFRGGIGIVSNSGDPHPYEWELCTWGFKARAVNSGTMKMITAAHCNDDFDANGNNLVLHSFFDTSNRYIADGSSVVWQYNQYCDCMKAGDGLIGAGNLVYHDDGANQAYTITSVRGAASQHIGDGVWMAGYTSGAHYTTIWDDWDCWVGAWKPGFSATVCGVKAGYPMTFGDSGGPAYYDHGAMGIISAIGKDFFGNNPYTMYIRAQDLQNQLNVLICVTSSC